MDKTDFLAKYGSKNHINDLLTQPLLSRQLRDIVKNPAFDVDHLDKLVFSGDYKKKMIAASDPRLTKKQFDKLIGDEDWVLRDEILRNPSLSNEHLEMMTRDKHYAVATKAKERLENKIISQII